MYTQFYGLREKPFGLGPDPRYLFLADSHREALAHLLYGIEQGEGFIEGDGIGVDITPASMKVWDAAVEKAYGGRRKIAWMEIYAGEKANALYGTYMPEETFAAMREFVVGIKGPG